MVIDDEESLCLFLVVEQRLTLIRLVKLNRLSYGKDKQFFCIGSKHHKNALLV